MFVCECVAGCMMGAMGKIRTQFGKEAQSGFVIVDRCFYAI